MRSYNESQSQVELLKLQLLTAKKSEWLHSVESIGGIITLY